MSAAPNIPDAEIDRHLDAILRASGSALSHYSFEVTKAKMRAALREAIAAEQKERKRTATTRADRLEELAKEASQISINLRAVAVLERQREGG